MYRWTCETGCACFVCVSLSFMGESLSLLVVGDISLDVIVRGDALAQLVIDTAGVPVEPLQKRVLAPRFGGLLGRIDAH